MSDYIIGPDTGVSAYMFGSEVAGDYWAERYFLTGCLRITKEASTSFQGMHDWNVDPHMAVPTINRLIDAGIEARGLFGQWDLTIPTDRFNSTIVPTWVTQGKRFPR